MEKKFKIKGMNCSSCQMHIHKAVSSLENVKSVNVDLLNNSMTVEYDEETCSVNSIISCVKKAGYKVLLNDEERDYKLIKLIVCLVLVGLIMIVSMGDLIRNPLAYALIQFLIVLPILIIYRSFFINGYRLLFKGHPSMESLIAIGATASIGYGIFAISMIIYGMNFDISVANNYRNNLHFTSAGMILTLVSLGKYIESLSKKRTMRAITLLMDLEPKKAILFKDGQEKEILASEVCVDDFLIIKMGQTIPVDGEIVSGSGSVNQSNITGESMPVYKQLNERVYASTILSSGYLVMRATSIGEKTVIANIIKLVNEASSSKAPLSRLADKISSFFVPIVIGLAVIDFIVFYLLGFGFELAFNFAISILVIACPCALGLATPVAIMVGTGVAAEKGLLMKNAEVLEHAHLIKTVVLDKTGTVTEGYPQVTDYIEFEAVDQTIAYSLEIMSEHPLAKAITSFSSVSNPYSVIDYAVIQGIGIKGTINNQEYFIGNRHLLNGIDFDYKTVNDLSIDGKTCLFLVNNNHVLCFWAIKDKIKKTSNLAIKSLQKMGIKTVLLTGDNHDVALNIAKEVGIRNVFSDVLPAEKQKIIKELRNERGLVAMVGDGVNDAPALTIADVSVAIGSGSDIALESSDIVLLRNDLLDVITAIKLSKRVVRTIKGNLFWAFFYNCIGITLASGLFYQSYGIMLNPMISSLIMSFSSIFVVLNALTINNLKDGRLMRKKVIFNVEGMKCDMCANHIDTAIKEKIKLVKVKSLPKKGQTIVQCDEIVDEAFIVSIIETQGYKVIDMKRK